MYKYQDILYPAEFADIMNALIIGDITTDFNPETWLDSILLRFIKAQPQEEYLKTLVAAVRDLDCFDCTCARLNLLCLERPQTEPDTITITGNRTGQVRLTTPIPKQTLLSSEQRSRIYQLLTNSPQGFLHDSLDVWRQLEIQFKQRPLEHNIIGRIAYLLLAHAIMSGNQIKQLVLKGTSDEREV